VRDSGKFPAYLKAEEDCGMDKPQFQSDFQVQAPVSARKHPSESVYQIAIIVAALLLVITASLF
jgi:hypothetical protein